ncbi:fibronectin type III domain-containing protein [Micromonospora sp. M51]|uniref:fibronectin type III domain-containing protein n=1 Tax=Micromonospora sp. M51 TaxID=2824889 RepID=UPI0034D979FE
MARKLRLRTHQLPRRLRRTAPQRHRRIPNRPSIHRNPAQRLRIRHQTPRHPHHHPETTHAHTRRNHRRRRPSRRHRQLAQGLRRPRIHRPLPTGRHHHLERIPRTSQPPRNPLPQRPDLGIPGPHRQRRHRRPKIRLVTPPTRATANPTAPPGPTGIITQPTATGFTITWGVPTNPDAIERYEVLYWDQDTPNAILSSTGIKGFSARIDGLKPNHRYIIAVASWNTTGSGLPNNARPIRVGTTTPTAPTGLQINPLDANTVQLTWTKNDTAAGYRVWTRDLTNGSPLTPSEQTFTEPTHGIAYLTSGFWNYEYCVTSINGTLESARTTCMTPTRPAGS